MSLVDPPPGVDCENTVWSHKKNRLYCRKFNWQDARDRHAAGEAVRSIASDLGVSEQAIRRAVDPEMRKRHDERSAEWVRRNMRAPCKGGCGALTWTNRKQASGYCPTCYGKVVAVGSVTDGLLRCGRCHDWKPDDGFPHSRNLKARRGRHSICRGCQAAVRQEFRDRAKVPCARCGERCLPAGERKAGARRRGGGFTDLCRACWEADRRSVSS